MDKIPFGRLQLMSPKKIDSGGKDVRLAGYGNTRVSNFSQAQMKTFITMRSLAASPLFVGGDLPTMDDSSLSLLTNREMLACNQNGECAFNVNEKNGIEIWMTQEKNKPCHGWIGIFNRNNSTSEVELTPEDMGFMIYINGNKFVQNKGAFKMLDIWNKKNFMLENNNNLNASIEANDVMFLKYIEELS